MHIDIRINKAKQLLSEGDLKINAVAIKCGFSTVFDKKEKTDYSIKIVSLFLVGEGGFEPPKL